MNQHVTKDESSSGRRRGPEGGGKNTWWKSSGRFFVFEQQLLFTPQWSPAIWWKMRKPSCLSAQQTLINEPPGSNHTPFCCLLSSMRSALSTLHIYNSDIHSPTVQRLIYQWCSRVCVQSSVCRKESTTLSSYSLQHLCWPLTTTAHQAWEDNQWIHWSHDKWKWSESSINLHVCFPCLSPPNGLDDKRVHSGAGPLEYTRRVQQNARASLPH